MLEKVQRRQTSGFISTITIAEILSLYHGISERRAIQAKSYVETIIEENNIIPVLKLVAEAAGKIKASYRISLADALIIATTILAGCDYLVSLDRDIKKIGLVEVKEPRELDTKE